MSIFDTYRVCFKIAFDLNISSEKIATSSASCFLSISIRLFSKL